MRTHAACLACVLMAASTASVGAEKPLPGISRFALTARLDARPSALESPRFTLRASLVAAPARAFPGKLRLALQAKLVPRAGALCEGPGFVFGDGFEAP